MLQTKRRDLREKILLRDTEDKLRAARASIEEEEEENKGTSHSFLFLEFMSDNQILIYVQKYLCSLSIKLN